MGSLMEYRRRILLNTPHLESASGSVAHFSTDMASKLKECKVNFLPQQAGTGDPSPSNVRNISGWTGVTLTQTGKNLYDEANYPLTVGWVAWTSGVIYESSNNKANQIFMPFDFGGQTVTLNKRPNGTNPGFAFFSNNPRKYIGGVQNSNKTAGTPWTVTVPEGTQIMRFTVPLDATDIQLELGSESTVYEPFQSNQITVSWADLGMIYGGFIDVLRGELVATYGFKRIVGNESWIMSGAITGFCAYRPTLIGFAPATGRYSLPICDKFKGVDQFATREYWATINQYGNFYFGAPEELSTSEAVNAWVQSIGGIDVAYPLATPITYPLTPEIIKAIKGVNNVFSDAGDVEVRFWTH